MTAYNMCIYCNESGCTEWKQNDDGHFVRECKSCGKTAGPFLSETKTVSEAEGSKQSTLGLEGGLPNFE